MVYKLLYFPLTPTYIRFTFLTPPQWLIPRFVIYLSTGHPICNPSFFSRKSFAFLEEEKKNTDFLRCSTPQSLSNMPPSNLLWCLTLCLNDVFFIFSSFSLTTHLFSKSFCDYEKKPNQSKPFNQSVISMLFECHWFESASKKKRKRNFCVSNPYLLLTLSLFLFFNLSLTLCLLIFLLLFRFCCWRFSCVVIWILTSFFTLIKKNTKFAKTYLVLALSLSLFSIPKFLLDTAKTLKFSLTLDILFPWFNVFSFVVWVS